MDKSIEKVSELISHGVYVIAVADEELQYAFTANWVMQVCSDPFMLAFCINPNEFAYKLLKTGGVCTLNILARDQLAFAEHFADTNIKDKMAGFLWQQGKTSAPVLTESQAYLDCSISHYASAGENKIAICKVIDAAILNENEQLLQKNNVCFDIVL